MDAPYMYFVRFWVHPTEGKPVIDWLDKGHIADVVAEPGFLWARRVRLEQDAPDGWHGYIMYYGLESKAALDAYAASEAPKRFAAERKPIEHLMRTERTWGATDFSVTKKKSG